MAINCLVDISSHCFFQNCGQTASTESSGSADNPQIAIYGDDYNASPVGSAATESLETYTVYDSDCDGGIFSQITVRNGYLSLSYDDCKITNIELEPEDVEEKDGVLFYKGREHTSEN